MGAPIPSVSTATLPTVAHGFSLGDDLASFLTWLLSSPPPPLRVDVVRDEEELVADLFGAYDDRLMTQLLWSWTGLSCIYV